MLPLKSVFNDFISSTTVRRHFGLQLLKSKTVMAFATVEIWFSRGEDSWTKIEAWRNQARPEDLRCKWLKKGRRRIEEAIANS